MKINSFLIQKLNKTSIEVRELINEKKVLIDGIPCLQKQKINHQNSIEFESNFLQKKEDLFYYSYHKPRGIESTMNKNIDKNLYWATNLTQSFFPIGRLDKDSEGLMILTNDGKIYNKITKPSAKIEKEYYVELDKAIDSKFIKNIESGVNILGKLTQPCKAVQISNSSFNIILKEGMNKQIRRMCHKNGFEVTLLKRIRIGKLLLSDLKLGQLQQINLDDFY